MGDSKKQTFPSQEEIDDFKVRVEIVQDGISKLLKDNLVEMVSTYKLPHHNPHDLPADIKLALTVLASHGIVFTSRFNNLKKKGKK